MWGSVYSTTKAVAVSGLVNRGCPPSIRPHAYGCKPYVGTYHGKAIGLYRANVVSWTILQQYTLYALDTSVVDHAFISGM